MMKLRIKIITLNLLAILCMLSGSLALQAADIDAADYGRGRGDHGKKPWRNENKESNNVFINNKTNYAFTISVATRAKQNADEAGPSPIKGKRGYRELMRGYQRNTMKNFDVTGPGAITDTLSDSVFGLTGTKYVVEIHDTDNKFESSSHKQAGKFEWKGDSMTKTLVFPKAQKTDDKTKNTVKVHLEINYNNGRIDILLSPVGY